MIVARDSQLKSRLGSRHGTREQGGDEPKRPRPHHGGDLDAGDQEWETWTCCSGPRGDLALHAIFAHWMAAGFGMARYLFGQKVDKYGSISWQARLVAEMRPVAGRCGDFHGRVYLSVGRLAISEERRFKCYISRPPYSILSSLLFALGKRGPVPM